MNNLPMIFAVEHSFTMGVGTNRWTAVYCKSGDDFDPHQCIGYFATREQALQAASMKHPEARIG